MDTQLYIVIMSIVGLHLAALVGGGLALGVMRLFGHRPATANGADARDSLLP